MRPLSRALATGVVALAFVPGTTGTAIAADSPGGFYWGSDSNSPTPGSSASSCASSGAPWNEPNVKAGGSCGVYGGYYGEIGGYWTSLGCSGFSNAFNQTAATRAETNGATYGFGMGAVGYWFGGGAGIDPNYNGTTSEATAWGKAQAKKAAAVAAANANLEGIIIFDVEDDYPKTVPSGWLDRVSGCSTFKSTGITSALDRAVIDGFVSYMTNSTAYSPALYSSPGEWSKILGSGANATITNVMEITADYSNCTNPGPTSWTQAAGSCSSNSANFFSGIGTGSSCALGWQWTNQGGDYDQLDINRLYACQ